MAPPDIRTAPLALFLAVALTGCGGEVADGAPATGGEAAPPASTAVPSATPAGDPDQLAEDGARVFQEKGCNACHKIGGGRLVGPDLAGVTERRKKAWIKRMILRPDSMVRNDPEAKALLAEYYTPMQDMGVTEAQAEALYHYLHRETERAGSAGP